MHAALALAPLTLAAVLVLSGLAKRPDPQSTHSMMSLLRLPRPVATLTMARVVPWLELAIAALLLTPWRWTYALGAVAALGLFLVFWVIIARAMTFDPRPSCGCFGRVGDHRINGRTVTRNTILVGLALVSGWIAVRGGSGTGLLADFAEGDWLWLLLAVALAAVTWFVVSGPVDEDADGAVGSVRTPVPSIPSGVLVDRAQGTASLHQLVRRQAQLLVLANCWCGSTIAAIQRLPGWRERLPRLGVQLVHTLRPWDDPRLATLDGVWWDPGSQLYDALQSGPSPAAVLLDMDGRLVGGPVNGVEGIEQLVTDIAAERPTARAAP